MNLARYGSRLLALWCALCAAGFFGTAAWLEAKVSRFARYEPPADLIATLQRTDNIDVLRTMAINSVHEDAYEANYGQISLPTKAFISLALSAGGAFLMTAALAWGLKREKEETK